jgi:hypothetical protein
VSVLPDPELRRHLPAILESPSLYRGEAETPSFEIKFLLSEVEANEVEQRLRPSLLLDPHADPALDNAYHVTSVYFDTAAFDVYRRTKGYKRRKFRIRRYGIGASVFLEQKSKSEQRVRKRRTSVPDCELSSLVATELNGWPGAWFAKKLADRGLSPVCRVSYQRLALIGTSSEGPIRVTFDRSAIGDSATGHAPEPVANGRALLADEVIAEFKFLGAMPTLFKTVIEDLRLAPRPVSKYRRCVEAAGLVTASGNGNG